MLRVVMDANVGTNVVENVGTKEEKELALLILGGA